MLGLLGSQLVALWPSERVSKHVLKQDILDNHANVRFLHNVKGEKSWLQRKRK